MDVNSSKKAKRLSWEMSDWGETVGLDVSCGIGVLEDAGELVGVAVFVGITVGGKDVGLVVQVERTRLDTIIVEEIQ